MCEGEGWRECGRVKGGGSVGGWRECGKVKGGGSVGG